jgi:hypothetical protein
MKLPKKSVLFVFVSAILFWGMPAEAGPYGYNDGSMDNTPSHSMYLGFSLGDGAYFNYKCSYGPGCRATIVAPLDFEILVGFQVAKNFYLDLALNYSVDFYDGYYDEVTYLVGASPGIRFYLPGLFHRHFYFRGAIPIQYTLDDENLFIVGLLLGFGLEWRFGNMGVFVEADIVPYFMEVYPGYWVIPARARAGVAVMF